MKKKILKIWELFEIFVILIILFLVSGLFKIPAILAFLIGNHTFKENMLIPYLEHYENMRNLQKYYTDQLDYAFKRAEGIQRVSNQNQTLSIAEEYIPVEADMIEETIDWLCPQTFDKPQEIAEKRYFTTSLITKYDKVQEYQNRIAVALNREELELLKRELTQALFSLQDALFEINPFTEKFSASQDLEGFQESMGSIDLEAFQKLIRRR